MKAATLRKALWVLAILALPVGLWGLYMRLTGGHEVANYGSYVVWGLWVAMYLYFMELAAGCYLFATMDRIAGFKPFARMYRMALIAALAAMIGGLLHIWLDLGHPERFLNAYFSPSPSSVMTFMVWTYTVFGLVLVAQLVLEFRPDWMKRLGRTYDSATQARDRGILKGLQILSIPLVIAFSAGVGALFGVQGARPYWHVGMYPVAFFITALVSGAGLMLVLAAFFLPNQDEEHGMIMRGLARLLAVFLFMEALFLFTDYLVSLYGGLPDNVAAVRQVLTGPYAPSFWIIQVLIGMVIPFVIAVLPGLNGKPPLLGLAGGLVLVGFVVTRITTVLPALTVPEFQGLLSAFSDPRLSFDYIPSLSEWAVTVGIMGLALLIFLAAYAKLSLVKAES